MPFGDVDAGVLTELYTVFLDTVTASVIERFEEEEVPCVLLKGAAFARLFYAGTAERSYCDFDLLINPADRARVEDVLTALGFIRVDRDEDWLGPEPKYAHTFRRPRDGALVDLHWRLSGATASSETVWAALRRHTTSMDLQGRTIRVLDAPASALLVGLHNAHHGTGHPTTLSDLDRAVEILDPLVWHDALSLADEIGACDAFAAGLRLTPAGDKLADEMGLDRRLSVAMWLKTNPSTSGAFVMDSFLRTTKLRGRLGLCLRVVVPPRVVMYHFSSLARRGPLGMAMAYFLRPFRLAVQLGPTLRVWLHAQKVLRAANRP